MFAVAAFVYALEDPEYMEMQVGEPAELVFPAADAGLGTFDDQEVAIHRLPIGDVVCRGALAFRAAEQVRKGAVVRVVGRLELRAPLDYPREASAYVSMAILADGVDVVGSGGTA